VYEVKEISNKVSISSLIIYTSGFWFLAIIMPVISVNAYNSHTWTTILIQFSLLPVLVVISWLFSRQNTFAEWFDIVFYSGVRKVCKYMTLISNKEKKSYNEKEWWEPIFKFWWCFSIKYVIPLAVAHGVLFQFNTDAKTRYKGYPLSVNFFGWSILIVALLIVIVPIFIFKKSVENSDHKESIFEMMAIEHFTEEVMQKRKKPQVKEEKKTVEMKSIDANDADQSKSPMRTNRSIVATESNIRLDEED